MEAGDKKPLEVLLPEVFPNDLEAMPVAALAGL